MPRSFRHNKCGAITQMPVQVVATILRDPHLVGDFILCKTCGGPVPLAECRWVETGQDLQAYIDDLREDTEDEWTDSLYWPDETEELPKGSSER